MPGPKKKSSHNYYEFDMNKFTELTSFIIYGVLKNQIPDKKKDKLFRKTSVYYAMVIQYGQGFKDVYGSELADIANPGNASDEFVEVPGAHYYLMEQDFHRHLSDRMDPAIKMAKEGLAELAEIMKKKGAVIKFRSETEKNYYNLLQLMIEDAANERSWRDSINEDVSYEFAFNNQVKFKFTAAYPNVVFNEEKNKGEFRLDINPQEDGKILDEIAVLGITDASAGAVRVMRKLESHIKTGDVGRDELIREYEQQQARMEKALNINKNTFERLQREQIVQNDLDDFVGGARGCDYVLSDVIAKKDLLKAGWPASDIQALARLRQLLSNVDIKNDLEEKKIAQDEKKANTDEKKNGINTRKQSLTEKRERSKELRQLWNATIAGNGLTENERRVRLTNINTFLENAKNENVFIGADFVQSKIANIMQKELSTSEKALLSNDISDLVRNLNAVDPKLVGSSKQFASFKTALKELDRAKKNLDDKNPEAVAAYKELVNNAADKAAAYLRFKSYQNDGPDKNEHKRSDLEVKRINTVDSILSRLKKLTVPGSDELIIPQNNKYCVYGSKPSDGLLGEYVDAPKINFYDRIIARYTGRGVVNGTREQLQDAYANAIAAVLLKNNDPDAPYDKKKAKAKYDMVLRDLSVNTMTDEQLREALQTPDTLKSSVPKQLNRLYAPESEAGYESLIRDMRKIYMIMPKKNRGRTIYNEIYDDVEKLAHLPENLDGVDKEKAFRLVAKLNHGIFFEARKRSLKNLTNYDQRDRFSYLILHAIMDNCPNMNKLMGDFSNELNEARGTRKENNKFIISSSKYYDLDHYDRDRFDRIVGIMDGVRELSDKIAQDMYDAVKPFSPNEIRDELNETKQAQQNKTGAKEEPVKNSKLQDEPKARPRRNSMV